LNSQRWSRSHSLSPSAALRAISRRTSGRSKNTKAIENRILIKEGEAVEERDVLLHGPG